LDLIPDGGLARIRLWGEPTAAGAETVALRWWNLLPADAAAAAVRSCCASPGWAAALAAGRPFTDFDALLSASDAAAQGLADDELAAALAGHPRIGERAAGADSRREQAGVGDDQRDALAAGNRDYEQRFGHVYLVRAAGRSGAEVLALLQERLTHTAAEEAPIVRRELAEITALRLRRLWSPR
jgi:2-oxo-4-hydroxy-4-carboxy-5-ureidoimidazoline decarboxylase